MTHALVVATHNHGKLEELKALLADLGVEVLGVDDATSAPVVVVEDGDTFEENAIKKSRAVASATMMLTVADDTGLEVDALGGAPGVRSARFAGPDADDAANRARLLHELDEAARNGIHSRVARFRTVLAYTDTEGVTECFEGLCEGQITDAERGDGGFGYDALFQPEGATQTFAEMPAEAKNRISHRGRALKEFAAFLHARLSHPQ